MESFNLKKDGFLECPLRNLNLKNRWKIKWKLENFTMKLKVKPIDFFNYKRERSTVLNLNRSITKELLIFLSFIMQSHLRQVKKSICIVNAFHIAFCSLALNKSFYPDYTNSKLLEQLVSCYCISTQCQKNSHPLEKSLAKMLLSTNCDDMCSLLFCWKFLLSNNI